MKKYFSILILFITLSSAVQLHAQSDELDPSGIMTEYLMRTVMARLYIGDEANMKTNKVKEVKLINENEELIDKISYDREGRLTEYIHGEGSFESPGKTFRAVYTEEGNILQSEIESKEGTVTLDVSYNNNNPEYLLIRGDIPKPVRFDIEMMNGKQKKITNENYLHGPISYLINYSKDRIELSLQSDKIPPMEVMNINFEADSIYVNAYGGTKIIFYLENNKLVNFAQYKDGKITSKMNYNYGVNGLVDEIEYEKDSPVKYKCLFTYYED